MKKNSETIVHEISQKLKSMIAFGESKHADQISNRENGKGYVPDQDKIYSVQTYRFYMDVCQRFGRWANAEHGVNTLEEARQYAGEWLQKMQAENKSAWSVKAYSAPLAKLFGCRMEELGCAFQRRDRADIKKHRGDRTTGGHYSEANHQDIKDICQATGLRQHELRNLKPSDVTKFDGKTYVTVRDGTGGKCRTIEALNDTPAIYAAKAEEEGREFVVKKVPSIAPCQAYRADFAKALYVRIARDTSTIKDKKEILRGRKDMLGARFDKVALKQVAKELGIVNWDTVVNYLYETNKS